MLVLVVILIEHIVYLALNKWTVTLYMKYWKYHRELETHTKNGITVFSVHHQTSGSTELIYSAFLI